MHRAITSELAGREVPVLFDRRPTSTYCIGVLTPVDNFEDDGIPGDVKKKADSRTERRRRRKPDALGLTARVLSEEGNFTGEVTLRFAVYYKQVPTRSEQLAGMEPISEAKSDNVTDPSERRVHIRQKYCRKEVEISGLNFRVSPEIDGSSIEIEFEEANTVINQQLALTRTQIEQDSACWKGTTNYTIKRADTENDEAYLTSQQTGRPELPLWKVVLAGNVTNTGNGWRLSLLMQNQTEAEGRTLHPVEIFDAQIQIELEQGEFTAQPFVAASLDYRYQTKAWGRGINAVLEVNDDNRKQAWTETLPIYEQPRARTRHETVSDVGLLAGDQALTTLYNIVDMLNEYAESWAFYNEQWKEKPSYADRQEDLTKFQREIERFRFGVEALEQDGRLLRAFQLANEAATSRPGRPLQAWRLFQLVFIVSQAPSLLSRERPDDKRLRQELETVDVLWYPTGGGKTEAYFGVLLMAMFYDRLRGKYRGISGWLRYPLRMLSIQQLQRLTDFVVAAEEVRRKHQLDGDSFSVGYYVGSSNTPNQLTFPGASTQVIDDLAREARLNPNHDLERLHVLQRCPYCGTSKPAVEVNASRTSVRLLHRCRDKQNCGRVAPIYLSDSEIYRFLPTVLVGTVDRLARAGQTDLFSHVLGQVEERCPQHGYLSFDECVEGPVCEVKKRERQQIEPVYDPTPALLMQDELHLLKESLGTYDAHYEGFLDAAAARIGTGLPSKRLAATATIEGYEEHVRELYSRESRRFPEKGREEWDSAYAEMDTQQPVARIYMGILPFGIDVDLVAQRLAQTMAREAQTYWEQDDRNETIANLYDLMLVYANRKSAAGNIGARLKDDYHDEHSIRSLTGDRSLDEVRATIDQIEGDERLPYSHRLKTLIATSLISHGVDLDRLNVMAFAGFPGRAPDYIQSSSRVGRNHVGLVCTVFDPSNNLDRSTYSHFYEYHERLYQLVQPVPINRFSEASVKRTVTGLYSALLMNVVAPQRRRSGSWKKSLLRADYTQEALDKGIVTDEEMAELLAECYAIDQHGLPSEMESLLRRIISKATADARNSIQLNEEYATYQRLRPAPIASLREVEEQVSFRVASKQRYQVEEFNEY